MSNRVGQNGSNILGKFNDQTRVKIDDNKSWSKLAQKIDKTTDSDGYLTADQLEKIDKNNDGRITKKEARSFNKLSGAELEDVFEQVTSGKSTQKSTLTPEPPVETQPVETTPALTFIDETEASIAGASIDKNETFTGIDLSTDDILSIAQANPREFSQENGDLASYLRDAFEDSISGLRRQRKRNKRNNLKNEYGDYLLKKNLPKNDASYVQFIIENKPELFKNVVSDVNIRNQLNIPTDISKANIQIRVAQEDAIEPSIDSLGPYLTDDLKREIIANSGREDVDVVKFLTDTQLSPLDGFKMLKIFNDAGAKDPFLEVLRLGVLGNYPNGPQNIKDAVEKNSVQGFIEVGLYGNIQNLATAIDIRKETGQGIEQIVSQDGWMNSATENITLDSLGIEQTSRNGLKIEELLQEKVREIVDAKHSDGTHNLPTSPEFLVTLFTRSAGKGPEMSEKEAISKHTYTDADLQKIVSDLNNSLTERGYEKLDFSPEAKPSGDHSPVIEDNIIQMLDLTDQNKYNFSSLDDIQYSDFLNDDNQFMLTESDYILIKVNGDTYHINPSVDPNTNETIINIFEGEEVQNIEKAVKTLRPSDAPLVNIVTAKKVDFLDSTSYDLDAIDKQYVIFKENIKSYITGTLNLGGGKLNRKQALELSQHIDSILLNYPYKDDDSDEYKFKRFIYDQLGIGKMSTNDDGGVNTSKRASVLSGLFEGKGKELNALFDIIDNKIDNYKGNLSDESTNIQFPVDNMQTIDGLDVDWKDIPEEAQNVIFQLGDNQEISFAGNKAGVQARIFTKIFNDSKLFRSNFLELLNSSTSDSDDKKRYHMYATMSDKIRGKAAEGQNILLMKWPSNTTFNNLNDEVYKTFIHEFAHNVNIDIANTQEASDNNVTEGVYCNNCGESHDKEMTTFMSAIGEEAGIKFDFNRDYSNDFSLLDRSMTRLAYVNSSRLGADFHIYDKAASNANQIRDHMINNERFEDIFIKIKNSLYSGDYDTAIVELSKLKNAENIEHTTYFITPMQELLEENEESFKSELDSFNTTAEELALGTSDVNLSKLDAYDTAEENLMTKLEYVIDTHVQNLTEEKDKSRFMRTQSYNLVEIVLKELIFSADSEDRSSIVERDQNGKAYKDDTQKDQLSKFLSNLDSSYKDNIDNAFYYMHMDPQS